MRLFYFVFDFRWENKLNLNHCIISNLKMWCRLLYVWLENTWDDLLIIDYYMLLRQHEIRWDREKKKEKQRALNKMWILSVSCRNHQETPLQRSDPDAQPMPNHPVTVHLASMYINDLKYTPSNKTKTADHVQQTWRVFRQISVLWGRSTCRAF